MTSPLLRILLVCIVTAAATAWAAPAPVAAAAIEASGATALNARYSELRSQLDSSPFGRPVVLQSSESGRNQNGDVYAVVEHPFNVVEQGLNEAKSWCDVMILPYNTKHCHAEGPGRSTSLTLRIGRKADQAPEDANPIKFRYAVESATADYLRVTLGAAEGPLGTRDYRIVLEATPIDARHTFIHLGYSYGFSAMARLAMQAYLATAGAHKVGFTVTGKDNAGHPVYVKGMLGATERNTMRYFLAIEAFLGSLSAPEAQRVDKRLNDWYNASLKYPKQLAELERGEYLAMKRKETARLMEAL